MKYIVLLNGFPRSGKNTFIDYIYKYTYDSYNYPMLNQVNNEEQDSILREELYRKNWLSVFDISFVTEIKKIAKEHLGWNGSKEEKDRKFLSDFANLTQEYNNFCINSIIKKEEIISSVKNNFIYIIDIRNPEYISNLYQYFSLKGFSYTVCSVFIERNDTIKQYQNKDDNNVLDYSYDYYIDNNSDIINFYSGIETFFNKFIFG